MVASIANENQPVRNETVQILRGLASIAVAWFHVTNNQPKGLVQSSGSYGWTGVEAFFVISGFVIPYSMYCKNYTVSQFPKFMIKRFIRIEPAYLVSIFLVIALWHISALAPGFNGPAPSYTMSQITAHLLYLIPFTQKSWLNVVYWTLALEFVFYVLMGLTFPWVKKESKIYLSSIFIAIIVLGPILDSDLYLAAHFLVGMTAFRYFVGIDAVPAMSVMIAAIATLIYLTSGGIVVIVSICTAMLIMFGRFPRVRALAFLGSISYSLYLVHVPVGQRIVHLMQRFGTSEFHNFFGSLSALSVSVIAATLLWLAIERPTHRMSKKLH